METNELNINGIPLSREIEQGEIKKSVKLLTREGRSYDVNVAVADASPPPSLPPTAQEQSDKGVNGHKTPAKSPPPPTSMGTHEYSVFAGHVKHAHNHLNQIRMNLRYHTRQPRLLHDLNLGELRAQLNEIEARVNSKDVSEPRKSVRPFDRLPPPGLVVADTLPLVMELVDDIVTQHIAAPSTLVLFMGSEGVNLGRNGSLIIIQFYIPNSNKLYLLDLQTLGAATFTTNGVTYDNTLKELLESREVVKVWWDCREDSDAFYAHFGVALAGVVDAQLVENAISPKQRKQKQLEAVDRSTFHGQLINLSDEDNLDFRYVNAAGWYAINKGLASILKDTKDGERKRSLAEIREKNNMPGYEQNRIVSALTQRPLHPVVIDYCVQKVVAMPLLLERCMESKYWSSEWKARVQKQSTARLKVARSPSYYPGKWDMRVAPKGWSELPRTDQTEQYWYGDDLIWPANGF